MNAHYSQGRFGHVSVAPRPCAKISRLHSLVPRKAVFLQSELSCLPSTAHNTRGLALCLPACKKSRVLLSALYSRSRYCHWLNDEATQGSLGLTKSLHNRASASMADHHIRSCHILVQGWLEPVPSAIKGCLLSRNTGTATSKMEGKHHVLRVMLEHHVPQPRQTWQQKIRGADYKKKLLCCLRKPLMACSSKT